MTHKEKFLATDWAWSYQKCKGKHMTKCEYVDLNGWPTGGCWTSSDVSTNKIYTVTMNVQNAQLSQSAMAAQLQSMTITQLGALANQFAAMQMQTPISTGLSWYGALGGNAIYPSATTVNYIIGPETAEQKAARELREAERKAAQERAEGLLFTILTPAQVRSYKDDGHFEAPVNGRIYRIRRGRSRNIELLERGKATARFCAHPSDAYDIPEADVVLSQLLALSANEAEFLRVANRSAA